MLYLYKKTWRDLWNLKTQFAAVLLMSFFATFMFSGMEGVYLGMLNYADEWFEESNTADAWITGVQMDANDVSALLDIQYIKEAQPETSLLVDMEAPNRAGRIMLMASNKNVISMPHITSGAQYEPHAEGIWLYENFAEEHDIEIGDTIRVQGSERSLSLKVEGLVLSPEYLNYTGSAATLKPNHYDYGYGYISPKNMQLLDGGDVHYNQVKITYTQQWNEDREDYEDLDGDNIKNTRSQIEDALDYKNASYSDRTDFKGISAYTDKFLQLRGMAVIFSVLLILLSMLCIQTTIKRMIETQRIQIGTLKAIGYSNAKIRIHFLTFGFWVSLIGGLFGVSLAPITISKLLLEYQKDFYSVPEWRIENSWMSIALLVVIVIICSFAALSASRKGTKDMPAITMRNEPPKSNGHIPLERFHGLWESMSYEWKWTFRVTARNKGRTLIGIIGIAGSIMLLMASLGLYESLRYANETLYGTQFDYETKVVFKPNAVEDEKASFLRDEAKGNGQWLQEASIDIRTSKERINSIIQIYDEGYFYHFEDLDGMRTDLPEDGIAISRLLANELNLQINDKVQFRIAGQSEYINARIDNIITPSSPQGLYLTKAVWSNLGQEFIPNTLLVGDEKISDISDDQYAYIREIIPLEYQLEQANEILASTGMVIIMLILGALLLSVIILYNLGILSFTERAREYATLKVIGYREKELKAVIRRDNIIQLLFGMALGVPVGYLFLRYYVAMASTSTFEYVPHISIYSMGIVLLIICSITYLVGVIVSRKALKLNMIEALKSVE